MSETREIRNPEVVVRRKEFSCMLLIRCIEDKVLYYLIQFVIVSKYNIIGAHMGELLLLVVVKGLE